MRSLPLLVFSLLFFAGCGNGDADPAVAPTPDEPVAAATPTVCEEGDLVILEEQLGDGPEAVRENTVTINYEGRFEDGEVFDSGEGVRYPLEQFVPGFRDGIVGMKVGGQRQLTIPPMLGYGPGGNGRIPPCATLIFDVELLGIE